MADRSDREELDRLLDAWFDEYVHCNLDGERICREAIHSYAERRVAQQGSVVGYRHREGKPKKERE